MREVIPGLRQLAILADFGNPATVLEMGEVQVLARKLGLEVVTLEIRRAEDIAPAFEAFKGRADGSFHRSNGRIGPIRGLEVEIVSSVPNLETH